jgi:pilus assembly protein TadC
MNPTIAALLLAIAIRIWPAPAFRSVRERRPPRPIAALRPAAVAAVGVLATGQLLGIPLLVTVPVSAGVAVVLLRRRPRRSRALLRADRRLLAEQADLFAACLEAGTATGQALSAAVEAVADRAPVRPRTVPSPVDGLRSVAALLALGATAASAWQPVADDPDLGALAAAAARSGVGGAALAAAVRAHAADLRRRSVQEDAASAGRAGVAIVAPLAVCFLPAFLCLGLAPVVVALLRSLGIG